MPVSVPVALGLTAAVAVAVLVYARPAAVASVPPARGAVAAAAPAAAVCGERGRVVGDHCMCVPPAVCTGGNCDRGRRISGFYPGPDHENTCGDCSCAMPPRSRPRQPPPAVRGRLVPNMPTIAEATLPNNPHAQIAHVRNCAGTSFDMFVHDPKNCIHISKALLAGGWECHIINPIAAMMKHRPDEYFMDIGSNIGAFSLTLAHTGAKVLAFEAMQYNVELQSAPVGTMLDSSRQQHPHLFHVAVAPETGGELCIHPTASSKNENTGSLF